MRRRMTKRQKREGRQLALKEQGEVTPSWSSLPEDCRRQLIELLAKLMLGETSVEAEVADE